MDKHQAIHSSRGTLALVISTLGLLTLGLLSPIGLVMGIFGLQYPPPRTRAITAVVLGGIGSLLLPFTVVSGLAFLYGFVNYKEVSAASNQQPGTIEIGVIGRKHTWTSVYPGPDGVLWTADDIEKQGEIFLPEQTPALIMLRSDDVLHCLYIPAAQVKKDAVPGRFTVFQITPMGLGDYDFFCTEYCGAGHSQMTGELRIVSQSDFRAESSQP